MAANNFKPFGIGASANVTTQAAYEALAALSTGFQAGTASSAQVNKALRQGSVMASVLAQFIANSSGADVLDNGDVATPLANLLLGLKANTAGSFLQTANNFVEIKNAGATAVAAALANLGLGSGLTGVVGAARNAAMSVPAASATGMFTADELIVETSTGIQYRLNAFSQTINLATVGAGGMDTGTAPVSGYVALYAFFNPTTAARCLVAVNASTAKAPGIYGGANAPAGYTASALVSVLPTTAGSLLQPIFQSGRSVSISGVSVFSSNTGTVTATPINISSAVPKNATDFTAVANISTTSQTSLSANLYSTSNAIGQYQLGTNLGYGVVATFNGVKILTAQTIYYTFGASAGTVTFSISISQYNF